MANNIANIQWYDKNSVKYVAAIYHLTDATSTITFNSISAANQVWDGDDNGIPFGIVRSRFDFTVSVENSTQAALINIITSSYENDIYVVVTKSVSPYTSATTIFRGYLLQDTLQRENKPYPYMLNMTFTDSLGRTSEVDFDTLVTGATSVIDILLAALVSLEVDSLYSATDDYLKTSMGYVSDDFTPSAGVDPLQHIGMSGISFFENTEESTPDEPKVDVVLNELCRLLNSRLYYSEGIYHFESVDIRTQATYTWHVYKNDGSYTQTTGNANPVLNIDHSTHKIIDGAIISYLPPIKHAVCTYNVEESNYLTGILFDDTHYTLIQDIIYLLLQDDTKLGFEFTYRETLDSGPTVENYVFYEYRCTIKVGSQYWVRTVDDYNDGYNNIIYNEAAWQVGADYFYLHTRPWYNTSYPDAPKNMIYSFVTDTVPASGQISILVEFVRVVDPDGNTVIDISGATYENLMSKMTIMDELGSESTEWKYYAINDNNNSKILDYSGSILDYPGSNSRFTLLWITGGVPAQTDSWEVIGEAPPVSKEIQVQTLRSIVHFRQTTREQHSMSIRHTESYFRPYYIINYKNDGTNYEYHMIQRLDFDLINAISHLDMLHLEKGTNEPTFTSEEKKGVAEGIGLTTEVVETETSTSENYIRTTETLSASVAVTSVTITALDRDLFEGDTLKIYALTKKAYIEVMLSQDHSIGDTTLYFFSVTPTINYLTGSKVIPDPRPNFKLETFDNVLVDTLELTTLQIPHNPSGTILSESAMRRKVRVRIQEQQMHYEHTSGDCDNYMDFYVTAATDDINFNEVRNGERIYVEIEN